jgi:hypothetical protein
MARVDRSEYLKYHFENYFFRMPKLKDQVLNLLNVVFELNYNQSNSLEKKIYNTTILQEKKLLYFVDYFNEVFSKIKPLRDIIAHRGNLADQNLAMLMSYSLLKNNEVEYNSLLKFQIAYTHIFQKNQVILKEAIITLLLVIHEAYLENLKSITYNLK